MIVVGIEPFAIDITSFLDGVDVGSATARAVSGEVLGAPCRIISREDYRASKAASGRPKGFGGARFIGRGEWIPLGRAHKVAAVEHKEFHRLHCG